MAFIHMVDFCFKVKYIEQFCTAYTQNDGLCHPCSFIGIIQSVGDRPGHGIILLYVSRKQKLMKQMDGYQIKILKML